MADKKEYITPFGTKLSRREGQVFELKRKRWSTKRIADELKIKPDSIKGHVSKIYLKMGVTENEAAIDRENSRVRLMIELSEDWGW